MDLPAMELEGCAINASLDGVASTLKVALVAPVKPVALAVSVYPVPAALMLKLGKLAVPFTGLAVAVPPRVPVPGFAPMAMVTGLVAPVTTTPFTSWMITATAGMMKAPTLVLEGCVVKASLTGEVVTLKPMLVAPVKLVALAVRV